MNNYTIRLNEEFESILRVCLQLGNGDEAKGGAPADVFVDSITHNDATEFYLDTTALNLRSPSYDGTLWWFVIAVG